MSLMERQDVRRTPAVGTPACALNLPVSRGFSSSFTLLDIPYAFMFTIVSVRMPYALSHLLVHERCLLTKAWTVDNVVNGLTYTEF